MTKPITKSSLFKLRDKQRGAIIASINKLLENNVNGLISGKTIPIDLAVLNVNKISSEFIIDYFNDTNEWTVTISEEPSTNKLSIILNFKLI